MQRGLGGSVFEPVQEPMRPRRDREVTIGPLMLVALGLALFALCAFCFLFGYSVGHRSPSVPATVASTGVSETPPPAQTGSTQGKPSAGEGSAQARQAVAGSDEQEPSAPDSSPVRAEATSDPAAVPVSLPAGSGTGTASSSTGQPPVRSALPSPAAAPRPASAGSAVQPVLGESAGIMVQIAEVSEPEDADVLVDALRKRGYAVTSHRDPADGLLHVQVGPFANRNDAIAMRQRLLNDGYNAIVEQ